MNEKVDFIARFKNSDYPEKIKKCINFISTQLKKSDAWNKRFDHFARFGARLSGRALAFNVAMLVIFAWVITGPLFGFSDTWQLIINTATTIVTFLMVFLIQHTQNRDTEALQVKLDELIRSIDGANNALLDLEEMEEQELAVLRKQYTELARLAKEEARLAKKEEQTRTP
ncbi:MAG: low affinity iron permease family protein [Gammaproteobacteria bacterium]